MAYAATPYTMQRSLADSALLPMFAASCTPGAQGYSGERQQKSVDPAGTPAAAFRDNLSEFF